MAFFPLSRFIPFHTPLVKHLHLLILALSLLAAHAAQGQYSLNISLPRLNYLALEAIPVTVSITNRSGADLTLGGPGSPSWLSFQMTDNMDRPLSPIDVSSTQFVKIPAGGTIQQRVPVTDAYAPTDIGYYKLSARVLHPASGDHYESNTVRFGITDVKPMWQQTFGVPQGYKEAGRARRYALIVFRDDNSTSLYFRLIDDKSDLRIDTYRLGPVNLAIDPQITLDRANRLHAFFLVSPKTYCHCIIKPDGKLEKRTYFSETKTSQPQLVLAGGGDPQVMGGEVYDPSAPSMPSGEGSRKASDRPPGL